MAFIKRTWLARIGTGLNKFIIGEKDANDKQTLVNSPDSVSQQGDVISADNLNDLEQRIEDEFTAQGTAIAGKQDALTFDDAPTQGSNNPVKSGGIFNAINSIKLRRLWYNPSPTEEFGGTATVRVSLGEYVDEIILEVITYNYASIDTRQFFHYKAVDGSNSHMQSIFITTGVNGNNLNVANRNFSFHTENNITELRFNSAFAGMIGSSSSISTNNKFCVPFAVYKVDANIYSN